MGKYDFVNDQNPAWRKAAQEIQPFPDWVGEPIGAAEVSVLHKVAFADPEARLHPLHNKRAAFLSAVYAFANLENGTNGSVLGRISDAVDREGIAADVEPYREGFRKLAKEAAAKPAEPVWALQVEVDGGTRRHYPATTTMEIHKSAGDLLNDFYDGRLPAEWYAAAARVLVKRASMLGMEGGELPHQVRCAGEHRFFSKSSALKALAARRGRADIDQDAAAIHEGIIKVAEETAEAARDMACALHKLDLRTKVTYSGDVPDPFTAFFGKGARAEAEDLKALCEEHVFIGEVAVPWEHAKTASAFLANIHPNLLLEVAADTAEKTGDIGLCRETMQGMVDKMASEDRNQLLKLLMESAARQPGT
jgi:hypothetical protein